MSAHDPNSPSVLARRAVCAGSRHAEAGIPETVSAEAGLGIHRHALAAAVARSDLRSVPIPDEDVDAVGWCAEHMDRLHMTTPEAIPLVEYQVDLAHVGIPKGGTLDFGLIIPQGPATIVDWKFGAMPADHPRWNWQMRAYAVGVRHAFGCSSITVAIGQPELGEDERWREHTFTGEEVDGFAAEIRRIVAATEPVDAPLVPGERQCRFCRARPSCAARATVAAEVAIIRDPVAAFRAVVPEDRMRLWDRLSLAISTLSNARDQIESEALTGSLAIPGMGVGEGRRTREWIDPSAAAAVLSAVAAEKGLPEHAIIKRSVCSPSEAEKALGKGGKDTIAGLSQWKPGRAKLVRVGA